MGMVDVASRMVDHGLEYTADSREIANYTEE